MRDGLDKQIILVVLLSLYWLISRIMQLDPYKNIFNRHMSSFSDLGTIPILDDNIVAAIDDLLKLPLTELVMERS